MQPQLAGSRPSTPMAAGRTTCSVECWHAGEHVGQPNQWINVVEFRCHDQVVIAAARLAPRSEPAKSHDFRPSAKLGAPVRPCKAALGGSLRCISPTSIYGIGLASSNHAGSPVSDWMR